MKRSVWMLLLVLCCYAAIAQIQVDSIIVKQKLKLNGYRVNGISNDTNISNKDSGKLITDWAAKKLVTQNVFDTAAMLAAYRAALLLCLKYNDTAAMLAAYRTALNLRVKYADSGSAYVTPTNASNTYAGLSKVNTFTTRNNFTSASFNKDSIPVVSGKRWIMFLDTILSPSGLCRQLLTYLDSTANRSPYTIYRRGSGTGVASWGSIDTSYFNGSWKAFVVAAQNSFTNGRGLTLNAGVLGLDTTGSYTWTGATNTFTNGIWLGGAQTFYNNSTYTAIKSLGAGILLYGNSGNLQWQLGNLNSSLLGGLLIHQFGINSSSGSATQTIYALTGSLTLSGSYSGTVNGFSFAPSTYNNSINAPVVAFTNTVGDVKFNTTSGVATFGSTVTSTQYKLSSLNTAPISSSDTGTVGEIRVASGYIYVCTATNTWVRSALTSW